MDVAQAVVVPSLREKQPSHIIIADNMKPVYPSVSDILRSQLVVLLLYFATRVILVASSCEPLAVGQRGRIGIRGVYECQV